MFDGSIQQWSGCRQELSCLMLRNHSWIWWRGGRSTSHFHRLNKCNNFPRFVQYRFNRSHSYSIQRYWEAKRREASETFQHVSALNRGRTCLGGGGWSKQKNVDVLTFFNIPYANFYALIIIIFPSLITKIPVITLRVYTIPLAENVVIRQPLKSYVYVNPLYVNNLWHS